MPGVNNKYTNVGMARWENANVGVIKWDPDNKAGEASVIDETTGTVYEIGGGGGGESDFSTAKMTLTVTGNAFLGYIEVIDNNKMIYYEITSVLSGVFTVILYKGASSEGTFITKDPITTYSGDITLGEAELDEGMYATPFTVTGDCSVTLVGSDAM